MTEREKYIKFAKKKKKGKVFHYLYYNKKEDFYLLEDHTVCELSLLFMKGNKPAIVPESSGKRNDRWWRYFSAS